MDDPDHLTCDICGTRFDTAGWRCNGTCPRCKRTYTWTEEGYIQGPVTYRVSAHDWKPELQEVFDSEYSEHLLHDFDVLRAIMRFGRASVYFASDGDGVCSLIFENSYD